MIEKQTEELQKPDRLEKPVEIESLRGKNIVRIFASSEYNYAQSKNVEVAQFYSWGSSLNYTLGTGEDIEPEPTKISNEKFFTPKEQKLILVSEISLGAQHVIILEKNELDTDFNPLVFEKVSVQDQQPATTKSQNPTTSTKKRTQDFNMKEMREDLKKINH